jgi:hypothetical protein
MPNSPEKKRRKHSSKKQVLEFTNSESVESLEMELVSKTNIHLPSLIHLLYVIHLPNSSVSNFSLSPRNQSVFTKLSMDDETEYFKRNFRRLLHNWSNENVLSLYNLVNEYNAYCMAGGARDETLLKIVTVHQSGLGLEGAVTMAWYFRQQVDDTSELYSLARYKAFELLWKIVFLAVQELK